MKEVNCVLKNYDLKINKINVLNKGYAYSKWELDNYKYILKKIDNQDIDRLNFVLKVQSKLNDFTPEIIKTKYNNLFYQNHNSIYYLYKYLEGTVIHVNQSTLCEIGSFLADLHNNFKKIKLDESTFFRIEDNIDILKKYFKYYNEIGDKEYLQIIDLKLSILNNIKISDIDFNKLTYQIIHGDFYKNNILISNGKYKIIDFDQCCFFYKEYEVLRGMFMLSLKQNISKKQILNNMKQFITGYYQKNFISSPIDAYNLYLYIQANSLSCLSPKERLEEEKNKFAIKRHKILKFLYKNKIELLEILGDNK